MRKLIRLLTFFLLVSLLVTCKDEEKDKSSKTDNELVSEKNDEKKELNANKSIDNKTVNNVIAKLMFTDEAKSFVRFMISAELIDMLSTGDGPYTIVAPVNDAFSSLPEEKLNSLHDYNKKELLTSVLKSHIIDGNLDTVTLVQEIKKGKGKYEITTISGARLTATKEGSMIVLTDEFGTKSSIGKSDLNASNGVIHLLDTVLGMN